MAAFSLHKKKSSTQFLSAANHSIFSFLCRRGSTLEDWYFVKNRLADTTYLVRLMVLVEALEHEFISDLVLDISQHRRILTQMMQVALHAEFFEKTDFLSR